MLQPSVAGFPLQELSGEERLPTLRIRDPNKEEKMAAIAEALSECSAGHPVFYEDEVDIHLDPKIGADWQLRGQQNVLSHQGKTKNIIWLGRCTAAQEKSVTSAAAVKLGFIYQYVKSSKMHVPSGKNDHADC